MDITEAYRRGLVETLLITLKDVDEHMTEGEAGFLHRQASWAPTGIADTIAELETWASFRAEPPVRPAAKPFLRPSAEPPPRRVVPSSERFLPPEPPEPPTRRVGRNEPCPCGSGKKFKKCCGARHG